MRVGRDTKRRIEAIKADTYGPMQELVTALARLEEHSGTKRIARPLKAVIEKLEAWQRAAHG
jgi:hypothetical protein